MSEFTPDAEAAIVGLQLGRRARGFVRVAHACSLGLPVVVEVAPVLKSGEPFPTRFWLTCELLRRRVARLEADGGVREAQALVDADPEFALRLSSAHRRYAEERDATLPAGLEHAPSGGVGGSRGGVKCLHAHVADGLAGNDNPILEHVRARILPAECSVPCVSPSPEGFVLDPAWKEPVEDVSDGA